MKITLLIILAVLAGTLMKPASSEASDNATITIQNNDPVFYPLVQDGYKDTITFAVQEDGCHSTYSLTIVNSVNWQEVRTFPLTLQDDGPNQSTGTECYSIPTQLFSWDGRNDQGQMMPKGGYYVDVNDTGDPNAAGSSVSTAPIYLDTKAVQVNKSLGKAGYRAYAHSCQSAGRCISKRYGYDWLIKCGKKDCTASVTYKIKKPANYVRHTFDATVEYYHHGTVYISRSHTTHYWFIKVKVHSRSWADVSWLDYSYKVWKQI